MTGLPDAAEVRRALEHQFRADGPTVDAAMSVVLPVLRGRDAEIERLRGLLVEYVMTGESSQTGTPGSRSG